jgi:uncharacterized protein
MARRVLVDSGPLVALLDRRDTHHAWARRELANLHEPLLTCEAVLSEVFFLLSRIRGGTSLLIALLRDDLVSTSSDFFYFKEPAGILRHLERYSSVPMSFADACLVRMCEIERDCIVFTTDRDFLTYRRHRRQPIPLISPF